MWDGDASEALRWEYVFPERKMTMGCGFCELMGFDRGFGRDEKVLLNVKVWFNYREKGDEVTLIASVRYEDQNESERTLRMFHEWKVGEFPVSLDVNSPFDSI